MMTPAEREHIRRQREQRRQETATFNLNRDHAARWFNLREAFGYVALVTLPFVALVCGFVIFNYRAFGAPLVVAAVTALSTNVLALVGATWKLVLSADASPKLRPETSVPPEKTEEITARPRLPARKITMMEHDASADRSLATGGQRRQSYGRRRPPRV